MSARGLCLASPSPSAVAADPANPPQEKKGEKDAPAVNLFDSMRKGEVSVAKRNGGSNPRVVSDKIAKH